MPESTLLDNPLDIVDISEINQDTADKILHAAMTQGFLMVEGHEFTVDEVDSLFGLSKEFFKLPMEEKIKYAIDESNRGFTNFGVENLHEDDPNRKKGDPKEAFNFAYLNLETGKADQDLPELFKEDKNDAKITEAIIKLRKVLFKVLTLLAMGLKIEEKDGGSDWFVERHDPTAKSGSAFRFLHYPSPKFNPEEEIRAGAHTDYGGCTLLFSHSFGSKFTGLEIHSPLSKKWEPVPVITASPKYQAKNEAAPLIINIGDQLCYWTNGILKSTVHRVKFPADAAALGEDRYSIVFFSHPADDTKLEPVPAEIVKSVTGRGASAYLEKHGKSITSKEHLDKRLAATYGWSTY